MKTVCAIFFISFALASGAGAQPTSSQSKSSQPNEPNDKVYEQLSLFLDVLNDVQENYVDETDSRRLIYGAASGLVRTLDPFSQFMEPRDNREIKAETEGQFGGIGIRLSMKDGWLTVLTPMPGTPAYRAGLAPNDRIVAIDGESAKDLHVTDAMDKLRGPPGTKVALTIRRWPGGSPPASAKREEAADAEGSSDGSGLLKDIEITRENIKIESVQHQMLEGRVAYVRVSEFSARTTADFREALRELLKSGPAGLILDLRYNPGGLLAAAVEMASDFLGGGKLVVYTQGRRPESRQDFRSAAKALCGDLPLVVLINEGSASGSEIVAGALQDHRRALIMGARSYGKASVQSVISLPDKSGLRLTVARYYTPNGRSIHRDEKKKTGGIIPDIPIAVSREADDKLFAQWEMIYEPGRKPRSAVKEGEFVRDAVLEQAAALIKAKDVAGRLKVQSS